jgi:hypothetical protein
MRVQFLAGLALLVSCSPREPGHEEQTGVQASPLPPSAMVLRMPDSAEIWFTGAMLDSASNGETCFERTVEIRRGGIGTPVPLLYTSGVPQVMDDTTMKADLMRDCARVDTYLVNTKTAQPRRVQ